MRSYIFDGTKGPMTPQRKREAQGALFGNMPGDVGSGMSAIAAALADRQRNPFPAAPGGNTPKTVLTGLFGLGSGGLY